MGNILRKPVIDHSESAFRLSSESDLLKPGPLHNQAHSGPKWLNFSKFTFLSVSEERVLQSKFVKSLPGISMVCQFHEFLNFIFGGFLTFGSTVRPELRLRAHRPLLQIKITLAQHSRTNSVHPKTSQIFSSRVFKKLKEQKNEGNCSHSSWSMRQPNWS